MSIPYDWVAGDTGSKLLVTCTNREDQAAIDLDGATVNLKYKIDDGDLVTREMTNLSPTANGQAEYTFGLIDDDPELPELTAGAAGSEFVGEVEIEDATGKIITTPTQIRKSIRYKPV